MEEEEEVVEVGGIGRNIHKGVMVVLLEGHYRKDIVGVQDKHSHIAFSKKKLLLLYLLSMSLLSKFILCTIIYCNHKLLFST